MIGGYRAVKVVFLFSLMMIVLSASPVQGRGPHEGTFIDRWSEASNLVVLAERSQPMATIILPADHRESTLEACRLFIDYVERMSGARLSLVFDPAEVKTPNRVWIGMRPELPQRFPDIDFDFTKPEEILMVARPGDLVLVGRERYEGEEGVVESGALLSVLTFLQERLGVRWLWPGELGTDIVESQSIAFELFEYRYNPQVTHRNPRAINHIGAWQGVVRDTRRNRAPNDDAMIEQYVGGYDAMAALMQEQQEAGRRWFNLQRTRAEPMWRQGGYLDVAVKGALPFRSGHAFTKWWELYAKDHPQWFALQPDGTRVSQQESPYPQESRVKLCVSNPELAAFWLDGAEASFKENPQRRMIGASPNDDGWKGYCVCDNCRAWDVADAPLLPRQLEWQGIKEEHVQLTDRYVRFWNVLGRGLKERFPDRDLKIGVWAYCAYEPAPVRERLEDNIIPGFVGILGRSPGNSSAESIRRGIDQWKGWAQMGASGIVWRPNSGKRTEAMPAVFMHRMGDIFNELADYNLIGFELDSVHHHWANQGPQYYVTTQLLWNPRLKAAEILDDYYVRAYGEEAAPYVEAYFAVFEQLEYMVSEVFEEVTGERWHFYAGLPAAYRDLKLGPTLGRDMAEHAWGNYLWEGPDARHSAEELAGQYLAMAEQAVADGPQKYRDRVAILRAGYQYVQADLDTIAAMNDINARRGDPNEVIPRAFEASERRERVVLQNIRTFAFGYPQVLRSYRQYGRSYPRLLGPPPANIAQTWKSKPRLPQPDVEKDEGEDAFNVP